MAELAPVFAFVLLAVVLACLAPRYRVESRDGFVFRPTTILRSTLSITLEGF